MSLAFALVAAMAGAILFTGQISRTFYACASVERGDPPPRARTESAPNPPRVCAPAQWRLQVPKPPPPQRPGHKNINYTNNEKKTYKKLVAHADWNVTKRDKR